MIIYLFPFLFVSTGITIFFLHILQNAPCSAFHEFLIFFIGNLVGKCYFSRVFVIFWCMMGFEGPGEHFDRESMCEMCWRAYNYFTLKSNTFTILLKSTKRMLVRMKAFPQCFYATSGRSDDVLPSGHQLEESPLWQHQTVRDPGGGNWTGEGPIEPFRLCLRSFCVKSFVGMVHRP